MAHKILSIPELQAHLKKFKKLEDKELELTFRCCIIMLRLSCMMDMLSKLKKRRSKRKKK